MGPEQPSTVRSWHETVETISARLPGTRVGGEPAYTVCVKCPACRAVDTKVVDSRLAGDASAIRRRRQCVDCGTRFTTFERVEEPSLTVKKSDGSLQAFDRDKLVAGISAAAKGRPVSRSQVDELAASVEDRLRFVGDPVSSSQIGLFVLDEIRTLDEVAYLRFASVYKNFDAAADFQSELELLQKPVAAETGSGE